MGMKNKSFFYGFLLSLILLVVGSSTVFAAGLASKRSGRPASSATSPGQSMDVCANFWCPRSKVCQKEYVGSTPKAVCVDSALANSSGAGTSGAGDGDDSLQDKCKKNPNDRQCYDSEDHKVEPAPVSTETEYPVQGNSKFDALMSQCKQNIETTREVCDEKQDEQMNAASNEASKVALMFGNQAASSIQAACSKMADLTQVANAAVAGFAMRCNSSIAECKSSCGAAKKLLQDQMKLLDINPALVAQAEEGITQCNKFISQTNAANQAMQNFIGTAANSSQCALLNSGTGLSPEYCKANPTSPGCVTAGPVDCTKPEFATSNKICVCARNPNDPMCIGTQKASSGLDSTRGIVDGSGRLANKGNTNSSGGGDDYGLPGIEQGKANSGGGEGGVDGSQGGGGAGLGGGSGGSGSPPGGGGGRGGASVEPPQVTAGFYGGGGGARFGGGTGGFDGGDPRNFNGSGSGSGQAGSGGPDLRQFLPGGKYAPPRHGMGGMAGPDGITGPHSDIWQKIQNRYQVMQSTLLP